MFRSTLLSFMLLVTSVLFASAALAANDPTLHEVYITAQAGRLNEAQAMMDKVLRNHPNSGRAHFVEAELLVKQGRLANAASELKTAERLAPGLPFANVQSVESLRQLISSTGSATRQLPSAYAAQAAPATPIPWGLIFVGLGLIAAVVYFARKMSQPKMNAYQPGGGAGIGNGFGSGGTLQPAGAGGGMGPMGQMGTMGGGMGSGILGGLATGAAVGAGMVAGEALMHRFTGGGGQQFDTDRSTPSSSLIPGSFDTDASANDMGGNDFGVSDRSSWDDGSSSGGGDGDWS